MEKGHSEWSFSLLLLPWVSGTPFHRPGAGGGEEHWGPERRWVHTHAPGRDPAASPAARSSGSRSTPGAQGQGGTPTRPGGAHPHKQGNGPAQAPTRGPQEGARLFRGLALRATLPPLLRAPASSAKAGRHWAPFPSSSLCSYPTAPCSSSAKPSPPPASQPRPPSVTPAWVRRGEFLRGRWRERDRRSRCPSPCPSQTGPL